MRRRKRVRHFLIVPLTCSLASSAANADVVAVISAASPVTQLSANVLADIYIFLGRTSRLPGGAVAVPIDQVEGSAARDAFYIALTGKSAAQLRAHWARLIFTGRGQPPREVANGAEAKKLLVENPNAIASTCSATSKSSSIASIVAGGKQRRSASFSDAPFAPSRSRITAS